MKKIITYSVVYILSALVFYGGSGINIASFCCNSCQSEGIKGIAEGYCNKVHHHNHEDSEESDMNCECGAHNSHCSLTRVAFDWDSSNNLTFKCEPDGYELLKVCLPVDLTVSPQIINNINCECSTGPPFLCPRAYLSLLTTLLI